MFNKRIDMKNQILGALKAKFPGVADAILERIAAKLAKTVTAEDQVQAAVDGVTFQQVLESYGDSRATEAQKTAVSNYEKTHGLKDGKPVQKAGADNGQGNEHGTDPAGGTDPDMPAWAKNLIESNKTLTERIERIDGERINTARRQQLAAIIDKLPESLRKSYERVSVDNLTDEQFTALTGEIGTEVDGIVKELGAKGAVFGRPVAGSATKGDALTTEQEAAIAKREGVPGSDGQPF